MTRPASGNPFWRIRGYVNRISAERKTMKKLHLLIILSLSVLSLILVTCQGTPEKVDTKRTTTKEGPADRGTGLYSGEPGANEYPDESPGGNKLLNRPYSGSPALMPHTTEGFTISREKNDCVTCHESGIGTEIPDSHYKNGTLQGPRYNCRLCHVPQSGANPPVGMKR